MDFNGLNRCFCFQRISNLQGRNTLFNPFNPIYTYLKKIKIGDNGF